MEALDRCMLCSRRMNIFFNHCLVCHMLTITQGVEGADDVRGVAQKASLEFGFS
jgi:hypothetical protein